jgi:hypothetical protein
LTKYKKLVTSVGDTLEVGMKVLGVEEKVNLFRLFLVTEIDERSLVYTLDNYSFKLIKDDREVGGDVK